MASTVEDIVYKLLGDPDITYEELEKKSSKPAVKKRNRVYEPEPEDTHVIPQTLPKKNFDKGMCEDMLRLYMEDAGETSVRQSKFIDYVLRCGPWENLDRIQTNKGKCHQIRTVIQRLSRFRKVKVGSGYNIECCSDAELQEL